MKKNLLYIFLTKSSTASLCLIFDTVSLLPFVSSLILYHYFPSSHLWYCITASLCLIFDTVSLLPFVSSLILYHCFPLSHLWYCITASLCLIFDTVSLLPFVSSLNKYFTEWVLAPYVSSEALTMQHFKTKNFKIIRRSLYDNWTSAFS